jgi:hypothetical protein
VQLKLETNSLAGERIAGPRHAVAFFDGAEEEYRVLLPFAKGCAQCGDRCFQFLAPERKAERAQKLVQAGVDLSASEGRSELLGWDESYLRGGRFVPHEMIEWLGAIIGGTPPARWWADMEWAVQLKAGVLVEYESRLNPLIEQSDAVVVCSYQVGHHSANAVLGVLRAHPWIVVNGQLERNPVYVSATAAPPGPAWNRV